MSLSQKMLLFLITSYLGQGLLSEPLQPLVSLQLSICVVCCVDCKARERLCSDGDITSPLDQSLSCARGGSGWLSGAIPCPKEQ